MASKPRVLKIRWYCKCGAAFALSTEWNTWHSSPPDHRPCDAALATRARARAEVIGADELRLDKEMLTQPLRWRRPRRIIVCSMTDLFEERVPLGWIAEVWNIMASATLTCRKRHEHEDSECWMGEPHTFLVLTKYAERMARVLTQELPERVGDWWPGDSPISTALEVNWPLPNVWLGVSAETQERLDERWPNLARTPAAVRFLSLEPLLGSIDLDSEHIDGLHALGCGYEGGWRECPNRRASCVGVDWVIVGGESGGPPERALVQRCDHLIDVSGRRWIRIACQRCGGSGWRPREDRLEWVRSIRDQCEAAGISFLMKQWGGPTPKSGGRAIDWKVWHQFPDGSGGVYGNP